MNISAFFIRNPIPAVLLFIMLSIAGVLSFSRMSIKLFPDIDLPAVVITIPVPGATPEQLENEVTQKLENRLASINGLKHIHSTLVDNAATLITVFNLEKKLQEAVEDVSTAVDEVRDSFPSTAKEPIITKLQVNKQPLLAYTISSSQHDNVDLSWFVENDLTKELMAIQGVAAVTRIGGVEREIQVLLNPTAINSHNITASNVNQQINLMQHNFSGGVAHIGGQRQPIRTIAQINNLQELKNLKISTPTGATVSLGDIATIQDSFAEQQTKALLNGKESVAFMIQRSKGFGDIEVGEKVRAKISDIKAQNPSFEITEVFEIISLVEDDYRGAMTMLAEGALLAIFVVLLFLGGLRPTLFFAVTASIAYTIITTTNSQWLIYLAIAIGLSPIFLLFNQFRTTIVAAIALPLSILPAFWGMHLLGISMNMMVTIALTLVVGILVDDAIVEIENIDRHIGMGKLPYNASIDAADEIGMAVIAITTTLIAVFLPTAFMPGIPGKFFYQFGMTASLAIFSSLLVARIITPMICAYFLKPHKHEQKEIFWMKPYLKIANLALQWRWITLVLTIVFFISSLFIMKELPKGFMPVSNASFTQVKIELAPGGTLQQTEEIAEKARKAISDIPHIEKIFSDIGGREARKATLFITFTPRSQRPDKQTLSNQIRERLKGIAGANFSVTSGGNGERYEMILSGDNEKELAQVSKQVMKELHSIHELGSISNSGGIDRQELIICPDYLKTAERGVSSAAIAQAIRIATIGDFDSNIPKFNTDERQVPIIVRLPNSAKSDINTLSDLIVMGSKGPVRIGDVATLSIGTGPLEINRYDRKRFVKLTAEIYYGDVGEIQQKINQLPSIKNLPLGITRDATGDAEVMQELSASFATAMGLAVLCIYFVLVLLFGKLSQPITILIALPLSIGGAVAGLLMINAGMSLPAMIGFLMLMGIAVKNSILLVEYIIDTRKKNPNIQRLEAVLDACHKRARPIIMTTIAMGAGMLPLVLALGDSDYSMRRPMAATVFGGLITSTFLSLIVIPAFYTLIDDASLLVSKLVRKIRSQ